MAACRELDSDAEPGLDDADSAASHGDQSGRGHAPSDPKHGSGRPRKSDPRPDSRPAILEAAAEEFAERGVDGTRMEHVAARAGFNKALVYKHFGSREGLFEAVLDAKLAGRQEVLRQLPDTMGEIFGPGVAPTLPIRPFSS